MVIMADQFPPDLTTDVGKVRVVIQDVNEPYLFTDDEIAVFIELAGKNIFRASASAIYAIAVNEALTYKYVKTDDLLIDGTKAADVLLKRAAALRQQAQDQDAQASDESFVIVYPFGDDCAVPEGTPRPWLCR